MGGNLAIVAIGLLIIGASGGFVAGSEWTLFLQRRFPDRDE